MRFQEIHAHKAAIDKLKYAVSKHHVSHAQHFLGAEGSGNLPVALAFATFIFCEQPQEDDACGQCASCIKMSKLAHPDLHFLFPIVNPTKNKSVGGFLEQWRALLLQNPYLSLSDWMRVIADENKMPIISVDLADEIQKKISLKAFEGGYKIAIIWLPELMNQESANKLLKLLEEPPERTIFLLVGNETESLLPTILSRVQTIIIPKLSNSEMEKMLVSVHQLSSEQAHEIALIVEGNYSEALTLITDDSIQQNYFDLYADWMRTCYKRTESGKLVALAEGFANLKRDGQKSFLIYALQMMRQCALFGAGAPELVQVAGKKRTFAENFSKQFPLDRYADMTELLDTAVYHIERNANPKILFMDLSVQLKNLMHN
jgi:DNA polymerase III subunit delta'